MSIDADALAASLKRLVTQPGDGGVLAALDRVTEACVDLFGVTGSGIMIADEQDVTRYVAASDGPGRVLEKLESGTGQGPCTEAFVNNRLVACADLTSDDRWPELATMMAGLGVHAVLGVPVRLGAVPVGTLDVYRDRPHEWGTNEQRALASYSDVVGTTLTAALRAHTAGELVGQLQYALDYRVVIERAVGFLMASEGVDAVTAFNRLRRAARNRQSRIGEMAEQLLATGRLPARP